MEVLVPVVVTFMTTFGVIAAALITSSGNRSRERISFEVEKVKLTAEIDRLRRLIRRLGGNPDES